MACTKGLLTAAILVMGLVLVAGAGKRQNEADAIGRSAMREVGNSNYKFSLSLYKELAKVPGNVFFSPLSVHSILTMLSVGAKENTLDQLRTGLSLPDAEVAKTGYKFLNKALKFTADKGVTVNIANKVYATKNFPLTPGFKQTTKDSFNSAAENVDFGNGETVRRDINQWVENSTNKKITEVVPSGTITSDTAMVLVNAVYFKGRWLTEFDPANSTDGKFNGIRGQSNVRFMESTSEFPYKYSKKLNSRIVELAYNGNQMSMVIILPFNREDFAEMENLLPTTDTKDYLPGQYDKYNVRVKIPKFRLEKETPLAAPLEELGMTDMFNNNADLSGLSSSGPGLKVSKVLHKAFVEVNEEGSEAAATTVLAVQTLSLNSDDSRPIDFIADQPFIFMIRHRPSNSVLFMGRYATTDEGAQFSPPTQTRRSQGQGARGQGQGQGQSSRRAQGSASGHRAESQQPSNDQFDVRSGAASTTNKNVQYVEQQQNYDLFD